MGRAAGRQATRIKANGAKRCRLRAHQRSSALPRAGWNCRGDAPLRFHPSAWHNRDYGPPDPAMVALTTEPAKTCIADEANAGDRPGKPLAGMAQTALR
jgi:hypothetical protein